MGDNEAPVADPSERPVGRGRRVYTSTMTRGTAVYERGTLWVENRDPASRTGATVSWLRRYQAADGQLYAVLLGAYLLLTAVPLLLIFSSYVYRDPLALAHRMEHRLTLDGATSRLFESVMAGSSEHKLSAGLVALIDLFFFGLGFGRVLQLAHSRSWGIDLRKRAVVDQLLYAEVLLAIAVMSLLAVVQSKALRGDASWIGWLLDLGWVVVFLAFFVWAPHTLLHGAVARRDILPGAVFTVAGLVGMRIISGLLLRNWLEWYSKTYGALGIVMAIFFWLIIATTILVLAAALSPALAHRRDLRRAPAG